ncbi:helix-turn-helix domain-containing protein [Massilia putida]|uniref:helix-turn-helix domain-containing protein n=1 Tax=Massilia putida TaxID=1141883 RepID=UPI0009523ACE|nr:XRE family transcriptional regulator [Massilia putida]
MKDDSSINGRIAQQVRLLRSERGLSLDALSNQCGVSRSMLSLIERGETSPTAVVLDKLAAGLGVPLASLFDDPARKSEPVARCADQVVWQDPHSGYLRRNVSPEGSQSPTRIVDVTFPPRARVTYEAGARTPAVLQQIWMLEGRMEIVHGADAYLLETGDCLAMQLDAPVSFYNPGDAPARYAVVLTTLARS